MSGGRTDRREFLRACGGALALSGTARADNTALGVAREMGRPNVLVVFDDQLRKDVCGAYGGGQNISTPHIDRLADQGVVFTNATSCCPLCTPFRGMLHTGRYPTHTGIVLNFVEVSAEQNPDCLAHVFSREGYDTCFIGKWHLAAGRCKGAGRYAPDVARIRALNQANPEREFVPPGPGRLGYHRWQGFNFHASFNDYWYYEDEPKKLRSGKYETDTQTDQAIQFMEDHKDSRRPFLVVVAPHPPHPPFGPASLPEGYLEKVPEKITWSPNVPANNPRKVEEMRCYLAMAKNVDDNVGRLMSYLDRTGLAENTIVVFTSDHGEMHGSHGRLNKMVPYTEAVGIPLIMRWRGKIAPKRSDALFTPMDVLPTLASLARIRVPRRLDGVDLGDVVLGKGRSAREEILMANYSSHWDYFQTGTLWPEWRGIRTGRYTYCKWLTGEEELYDDLQDPYQMNNLATGRKELPMLQRMRKTLKHLLAAAHDQFQPGTAYADWYNDDRRLLRTGLGPVKG
jgi:arylsulfatase A-like enzyme